MGQHEERALVLDAQDYRETSSLVRFFTENEGRISLVARGLKRPKSTSGIATIQPFNLVRLRYFIKDGATLGNMAGAELERVNAAPRNSIEAYALITYWFEILKETSQARAAATNIFGLSTRMLEYQESNPGLSIVWLKQLSDFCQFLGFGINWNTCGICGSVAAPASQFSIKSGSVICQGCGQIEHRGLLLQSAEQRIVAQLAGGMALETGNIQTSDLVTVLTLINRYLTYHLENSLKTFSFVQATFGE